MESTPLLIRHPSHGPLWLLLAAAATLAVTQPSSAKSVHASTDPVSEEPPITAEERSHWSFKPLLKPHPPEVQHTSEVHNDIDKFVLAKLEARGLVLSPPADPATLIRRVSFDITGLPPSPEQVRHFVEESQAFEAALAKPGSRPNLDPYDKLVENLLNSPRYGEKWAQYWLDLARFAETDGFEHDRERKDAWQYRDWVIDALNRDLPYDDFVACQIAGDELSPENRAATGFLLAGPDMPDSNYPDERRHLLLNDITATFGTAFFGLTLGCAQCHDHPFDPISQADFYRLRAFFDNLPRFKKDRQLDSVITEAGPNPPQSHVYIRGDHERPGPAVPAAFPRIANPAGMDVYAPSAKASSGRRTALARWLTQPTQALFLRATVNRLWGHHFDKPLAGTPGDLGTHGDAPLHPELLDWLATELPQVRWSLKAIHRLIVTSATYRQSSRVYTELPGSPDSFDRFLASQSDPDNDLLWHFPRRRLSGEELRDAMLAAAGRLNLKAGGAAVHVPTPVETHSAPRKGKPPTPLITPEFDRRSIYLFAQRNLRYPLFDLFDRPDALQSCPRRTESITAPQALSLFNSPFSFSIANSLATQVLQAGPDPAAMVTTATWHCYSRPPSPQELAIGCAFLENHSALTSTRMKTVTDYCLALLNASGFSFVD